MELSRPVLNTRRSEILKEAPFKTEELNEEEAKGMPTTADSRVTQQKKEVVNLVEAEEELEAQQGFTEEVASGFENGSDRDEEEACWDPDFQLSSHVKEEPEDLDAMLYHEQQYSAHGFSDEQDAVAFFTQTPSTCLVSFCNMDQIEKK